MLTLREAAHHHYTASMATLGAAARNRTARLRDYVEFRRSAVADAPRNGLRAVAWESDAQGRADSLARRLGENGIAVGRLRAAASVSATEYGQDRAGTVRLPAGAYVVDLAQPQGRLARALLEPDAQLDSSFIRAELESRRTGQAGRFYDVTAWSLPYTFRVRAWGLRGVPGGVDAAPALTAGVPAAPAMARHAYAWEVGSEASYRLLAALLADSVRVWYAPRSFTAGGARFPHGALLVRMEGNAADVHERMRRHAAAAGAPVAAIQSAAVEEGTDLGSNSVFPLRTPRVALAGGSPVGGNSFGFAWYAFDQRLRYPATPIDVSNLGGAALDDFDVLVVPSVNAAGLDRELGDAGRERIGQWVRAGGVLVTLDAATGWLASERTGLSRFRARRDSVRADSAQGAPLPANVPGAIVRTQADTLSPLLAGVNAAELPVLVFSDRIYAAPRDLRPGEAVVRYAPLPRLRMAGYLWPEVPARLAGTPYLWTERVGRGRVIGFAGDPNFRDLWRGLLPLFANSVFFGPSF
ncbi:MAG TPA: hypothetical protein VK399_04745 [Longimicrobiaceae bacterium]|nr:hypothetical protein [Longimicrobiaceae bacterium]